MARSLSLLGTVGAVLCASSACSSTGDEGPAVDPASATAAEHTVASSGASTSDGLGPEPDRHACQTDDDCALNVYPDDEPCCTAPPGGVVYSRAYVEWRRRWVEESCDDVECSEEPIPAMPIQCRLEAVCREGRCDNACPD